MSFLLTFFVFAQSACNQVFREILLFCSLDFLQKWLFKPHKIAEIAFGINSDKGILKLIV
jgi:hypothetical protein